MRLAGALQCDFTWLSTAVLAVLPAANFVDDRASALIICQLPAPCGASLQTPPHPNDHGHRHQDQTLYSCISRYDDAFDLVIIVDLKNTKNPEDFHKYLDDLNLRISEGMFIDKDIWLMGFNPEDEPSDFVEDVTFNYDVDDEYSMIFVQRLSKLQEAANRLDKKGYYDSYDGEYNSTEIYFNREKLYRRLKNGDET